jgi:hypothetical protein
MISCCLLERPLRYSSLAQPAAAPSTAATAAHRLLLWADDAKTSPDVIPVGVPPQFCLLTGEQLQYTMHTQNNKGTRARQATQTHQSHLVGQINLRNNKQHCQHPPGRVSVGAGWCRVAAAGSDSRTAAAQYNLRRSIICCLIVPSMILFYSPSSNADQPEQQ